MLITVDNTSDSHLYVSPATMSRCAPIHIFDRIGYFLSVHDHDDVYVEIFP